MTGKRLFNGKWEFTDFVGCFVVENHCFVLDYDVVYEEIDQFFAICVEEKVLLSVKTAFILLLCLVILQNRLGYCLGLLKNRDFVKMVINLPEASTENFRIIIILSLPSLNHLYLEPKSLSQKSLSD